LSWRSCEHSRHGRSSRAVGPGATNEVD
jgi:hypothetical protein